MSLNPRKGRTRNQLGNCAASGGPAVVSPPVRPHEWIVVGLTPFACCQTPRQAVTDVGQGAAVTARLRQPARGCASSRDGGRRAAVFVATAVTSRRGPGDDGGGPCRSPAGASSSSPPGTTQPSS